MSESTVHVTPAEVGGKADLHRLVANHAAGTTFVFAPGVYELTDQAAGAKIHKSGAFVSAEPGRAVLRGDPAMSVGDGSVGLDVRPGADGWRLEGFTVENFDIALNVKGEGAPRGSTIVLDNTFSNYGERAILFDHVVRGTIGRNRIVTEQPQQGGSDAVVAAHCELVLIHDNELRGAPIALQALPANRVLLANNRIERTPQAGAPGRGSIGILFGGDTRTFAPTGSPQCRTRATGHFAAVVGNDVRAPEPGDPRFHPGHMGMALVGPDEVAGVLVVGNTCARFAGGYALALQANHMLLAGNESSEASDADFVFGAGRETPGLFDLTPCGPVHDNIVVASDDATALGAVGEENNRLVRESELGAREGEYRDLLAAVRTEVDRAVADPDTLASVMDELELLYGRLRDLVSA